MNKEYCFECEKEVKVNLIEKEKEFEVRGKKYKYLGIECFCDECKNEVKILDEDLERREDSYRKAEGLITNKEIKEILDKYKIGKKPLAKLLGWSEVTIIRYLNLETPNKIYSDELYRLLKSSEYMEEVLYKNKNNITQKAFQSCLKAIKSNDTMSEINLIAEYIIEKYKDITPLLLEKILYYCQAFYMALFDNTMFEDDCEAWVHGPVYPAIYQKYKKYTYERIYERAEYFAEDILDEEKKKVIDCVMNSFGLFSAKVLENMTHLEDPWKKHRKGLKRDEKSSEIIEKREIKKYFEKVIREYDIENVEDIKKYSMFLFNKVIA